MEKTAAQLRKEGQALIEKAKKICTHENHRHDYDSDGPGYSCNDCGEYGYGNCPQSWPCSIRRAA